MTGPPPNEEAVADAANTPTAHGQDQESDPILLTEALEGKRLTVLQAHATRCGFTLHRLITKTFLLQRGTHSWHTYDLETIADLLKSASPKKVK